MGAAHKRSNRMHMVVQYDQANHDAQHQHLCLLAFDLLQQFSVDADNRIFIINATTCQLFHLRILQHT